MELSIVFPVFWGREKKEVIKDGDYFYDHPTPLDEEGTIPLSFIGFQKKWEEMMGIIAERRAEVQKRVFG